MTETKRYIDGTTDWFICLCGNQPNYDGFHSCLTDGTIVSPTLDGEWNGQTYICESCQRIIDGNTLGITGVASERVAYKNMRYNWDNH